MIKELHVLVSLLIEVPDGGIFLRLSPLPGKA